ncbi:hypothetical protein ABK040_010241 [Willaertia magna]
MFSGKIITFAIALVLLIVQVQCFFENSVSVNLKNLDFNKIINQGTSANCKYNTNANIKQLDCNLNIDRTILHRKIKLSTDISLNVNLNDETLLASVNYNNQNILTKTFSLQAVDNNIPICFDILPELVGSCVNVQDIRYSKQHDCFSATLDIQLKGFLDTYSLLNRPIGWHKEQCAATTAMLRGSN